MCGICGILGTGGVPNPSRALVERMTGTITHRGPNDWGVWNEGPIALGHRRLSVIDLSAAGRQPMANEDGSVQITFNGEIYNFRELKEKFKLVEKGHRFRSRTDTEVIIHLYEELGPDMARELNGMYAMAIWDSRTRQLHLIRDRYGIKPLFYQSDGQYFRFGSEIKAILADERVKPRIALQPLHDFFTFDYVPGQATIFDGISEVPPSHTLTVSPGGKTELRRYWLPRIEVNDSMTEKQAVDQARALLDNAVRKQLIADVPVGVLLSGGMDSSTLVALMKHHTSEPIRTYSIGFEEQSFNELPFARIVAQHCQAIHREVVLTPQLVRDMLPEYLRYIEEPYADGSAIPTYYVCRMAKGEVVVLLSGEGGDEAFAGYDTHAAYKASRYFSHVPRWLVNGLIRPAVNSLPVSDKKLSLEFKMKRFLSGQDLPPWKAHLAWRIVLNDAQKLEMYTRRVRSAFDPQPSDRFFHQVFDSVTADDDLNRILAIDAGVFLPDDLMIKNDRMSMAHSLEARVPFTDNELIEFMWTVPPRLKLPGLRKKNILRKAMEGVLPPSILNKKKVGLEMPYSRWFKTDLNDILMRYCGPGRIAATGLFEPAVIQRYLNEHLEGRRDHGRFLWGLLNFMMWLEMYVPDAAFAG